MNPIFGCKVKISADINPRNIWFDGLDNIPEDAILVTVDVSALYTNLNKVDSIEAVRKVLETRQDKSIPTDFIIKLLDLVLRHNIFLYRKPSDKYTCSRSLVTLHIVRTTSLTVLLFELFEFALTQVRET